MSLMKDILTFRIDLLTKERKEGAFDPVTQAAAAEGLRGSRHGDPSGRRVETPKVRGTAAQGGGEGASARGVQARAVQGPAPSVDAPRASSPCASDENGPPGKTRPKSPVSGDRKGISATGAARLLRDVRGGRLNGRYTPRGGVRGVVRGGAANRGLRVSVSPSGDDRGGVH